MNATENHDREALALKILEWMASHRTGLSSEAMAFCALGLQRKGMWDGTEHPHDPSDFNRCLLLLDQVPEVRDHFSRIAALSPQWSALIAHWDELTEQFFNEVTGAWSKHKTAPVTYLRMRQVLDAASRNKVSKPPTGD